MSKKEKLKSLFNDSLWDIPQEGMPKHYGRLVKFMKLARITFETFARNRMGFQCVSLSYFITLALVPFCALLFAITGGLGLTEKLVPIINSIIPGNPAITEMIIEKSGNIISIAKSGGVGVISALTFLWTILWMMFQVERVFNNVWGIRKVPRKIYKRFGFYFLVLGLLPFIVLVFGFGIASYANFPNMLGLDVHHLKLIQKIAGYFMFYIICTFTFSIMYKFIPAAKLKYSNALKAAAFITVIFILFQYLYLETQTFMARLNMVYGVLAAVPLFLIWLNFSWQIIIYGAELSYSLQNVDNYKECSKD